MSSAVETRKWLSCLRARGLVCVSPGLAQHVVQSAIQQVIRLLRNHNDVIQRIRVQAKSTGQLSAVAFVANVLGCMARIFTSYQDGAGMAMIRGFVLGKLVRC